MSSQAPIVSRISPLPQPAPVQPAADWPSPPPQAPGSGGALRVLGALMRRKWLVLGLTAAGIGAGVGAAGFVKPEYQVQGTVWIEGGDRDAANRGPIRGGELLQSFAWVELLKSYAILDPVVLDQRLYLDPALPGDAALFAGFRAEGTPVPGSYRLDVARAGAVLSAADGAVLERAAPGAPVGHTRGFRWVPPAGLKPGRTVAFSLANPRDVAMRLGDQLETRMAEDGHFLRLSLSGTDPSRIARTLNGLMVRYVEVAAQLKRAKLDQLTAILDEQRSYAEANLRDSETALESFRVRTVTLPSERAAPVASGLAITRDPVFNSYFEMKVSREDLAHDREAVQRVLGDAAQGRVGYDALAVNPAVQRSPELMQLLKDRNDKAAELRALRQRYTDDHPGVKRLTADLATLEGSAIPTAVRQLAASLEASQADVDSRIASASGELRQIPARAIEEARLQRRVEIANNLYGTLRQRYEEARLEAVSTLPDVKVLDPAAVPSVPVKDRRPLVMGGFAGGGLVMALLLVALLERADRRVRFPDQITGGMGLQVLGAVPYAPLGPGGRSSVQLAEAFRELRLSVLSFYPAGQPVQLTISSPDSGEGKTTMALNLARAFATQGHRTVLVDGDIRRGTLHRLLNVPRAPGLTDVLAGRMALADVLQPADGGRFTVLGSGTRMQNGPELLGSGAMTHLIAELRQRFSVVIVDSPPLSAGVDAYVLGTMTGNLLMILRTGTTDGDLAAAKLDLLDRLPVRVLGAVLNAVPPTRLYRYYSYLPGYGVEPESAVTAVVKV
ncbi:MAG TPA: polysaccharide biosynthesis tyrosine autokinase [Longimicrobiaceae bacterium]|jgi:tyrosine-protein kinase Etk/Wzc|nr:polysaccharide biosynthesis tyrosine autokinase [Longimicrobiaceae bacterium]